MFADIPNSPRYVLETISMTTVSERRIMREIEDEAKASSPTPSLPPGGSPISGILKGGKLWKQSSLESANTLKIEVQQVKIFICILRTKKNVRITY